MGFDYTPECTCFMYHCHFFRVCSCRRVNIHMRFYIFVYFVAHWLGTWERLLKSGKRTGGLVGVSVLLMFYYYFLNNNNKNK